MKYQQLRNQVRQLWADHAGGAELAPVSLKTWVQSRVEDALLECTDKNAREICKNIAFDLGLNPIQTTQFEDWLLFARDYGFAVKADADAGNTP